MLSIYGPQAIIRRYISYLHRLRRSRLRNNNVRLLRRRRRRWVIYDLRCDNSLQSEREYLYETILSSTPCRFQSSEGSREWSNFCAGRRLVMWAVAFL